MTKIGTKYIYEIPQVTKGHSEYVRISSNQSSFIIKVVYSHKTKL